MDRRQQTAAVEWHRGMALGRKRLQRRQQAKGTGVVDTPEQVRARAARSAQASQLQPEALVKAIASSKPAGAVKQGSLLTRKRCR